MQGKKKYFALILFLLIGLMVFTFANPKEDEQKEDKNANAGEVVKEEVGKKTTTNNGSLTTDQNVVVNSVNIGRNVQAILTENAVASISQTEDDSYAKALEMVKKAEESLLKGDYDDAQYLVNNLDDGNDKATLQDRLDKVLNAINVSDLVANLEKMVKEASSLTDMNDARSYNTSNDITNAVSKLENEKLKEELTNRLNDLNGLLSDEDSPVVTGINNGDVVNTLANVKVEEANTYTVTLNGKEYELGTELEKDGEYELVIVDAAFNETKIKFTYDTIAPVLSVKSDSVGTNGVYSKINFKLSDNVDLAKVIVNGKEYNRTGKWNDLNFQNVNNYVEGENTVVLVDKASNKTEFRFTYDKTIPTAVITFSNNNGNAMTNQDVTVILIANEVILAPEGWTKIDDVTYTKVYSKNAKNEKVVITDIAGNSAELKYEVKRIDKVAPTGSFTFSNDNGNAMTNKDVTVTLTTNESILTPEGWTRVKDKVYTKVYSQNAKNEKVVITDKAGNSAELKYEVKRIDKVAPTGSFTFSNDNGNVMTNKDVTVTLTTNESILTPEGWFKVQDKVYTKVYNKNTKDSVVITDKAGNSATLTYVVKGIDKEAPKGTITSSNNGATTNKDIVVTLTTNEEVVTPTGWTKVSDVKFTKVYTDNAKNETVTITDKVGNSTTITYEVKGINKVTYVNSVGELKTAISNAKAGDEIVVSKTINVSDLVINKAIILKGENGSKVNVTGNKGISVTASGTKLENLSIELKNSASKYAVSVNGATNVTLKNISVSGTQSEGVEIKNSTVTIDGANINLSSTYGWGGAVRIDNSTVTVLNSNINGPEGYFEGSIYINSGTSKLIIEKNNTINNGITSKVPSQTSIEFNDGRVWESTGGINLKTWTLK